jgi:hypothetical protein
LSEWKSFAEIFQFYLNINRKFSLVIRALIKQIVVVAKPRITVLKYPVRISDKLLVQGWRTILTASAQIVYNFLRNPFASPANFEERNKEFEVSIVIIIYCIIINAHYINIA